MSNSGTSGSGYPADGAVVLITGIMAAGKSTVAQALSERLPRAAHVRGDLFRRMIVSGRVDYAPGAGAEAESQLRLRHRLSAMTADTYAAEGITAVVQDVILGPQLAAYVALVRTRPLYVVVLAPDPQTVAEREAGRAKSGYGSDADATAWSVAALDHDLREHTAKIGLRLDSSELAVRETVDALLAGLESARVR